MRSFSEAAARRAVLALLAAGCAALGGCATKPPELPPFAEIQGTVPPEGLPGIARLAPDAGAVQLAGFWNDPKEREAFEADRARRVRDRAGRELPGNAVGAVGACASNPTCVILAPIMLPALLVTGGVVSQVTASRANPALPMSQQDGQRHVDLFAQQLTGTALAEHTLAMIEASPVPVQRGADYPRLQLGMTSARVFERDGSLRIAFAASARALTSADAAWTPSEHILEFDFRPKYDYTPDLPRILDALAKSIVSVYFAEHPLGAEKRMWDLVADKGEAQVRTFLERYPNGPHAELARDRLDELEDERRKAEKQAARARALNAEIAARDAARAKEAASTPNLVKSADPQTLRRIFAERARARAELEGRWSGVTSGANLCPKGRYALSISQGVVSGVVEWRGGGVDRSEVAGYVDDDGRVVVAVLGEGKFARSGDFVLQLNLGSLVGSDAKTCGAGLAYTVSLQRE